MSIKDWGEKIKFWGEEAVNRLKNRHDASKYYTALIIILVGFSSFGLGRLSAFDERREPITVEQDGKIISVGSNDQAVVNLSQNQASAVAQSQGSVGGKIVASRNGTKYYFPWCATNIAEKNKIWFNSEADARAKGLEPATNCKGLGK